MFELFFGGIWTLFTAFMTFIFYGNTGGTITVNGELVSQAEFNAMLGPKLFFALFWVIGFLFLGLGVKKLINNYLLEHKGVKKDGYIYDIVESGIVVNGRPYYDVKVVIKENNYDFDVYIENVGFDFNKYPIGSYVKVKHYKKDIKILGLADEYNVSESLKEYVELNYPNDYLKNNITDVGDTVIIDGVEYVRKGSL